MLEKAERIRVLLKKYISGELSIVEKIEFEEWLNSSVENQKLVESFSDDELFDQALRDYYRKAQKAGSTEVPNLSVPVVEIAQDKRGKLVWWVAAASVIIVVGSVAIWQGRDKGKVESSYANASQEQRFKNEVPSAATGAVLRLSDGREIEIDGTKNGSLAHEGNVQVVMENDKIVYRDGAKINTEILYNTVTTPRGKFISFSLPDNSVVFLNASSKIYFPVQFSGKERKVIAEGEVYFSVSKNKQQPFIVETPGMTIEVTGTEFSMRNYKNDDETVTSLVEGKVSIRRGDNKLTLAPGQQAIINAKSDGKGIRLIKDANLEKSLAWKEGLFLFEKTPIEDIMKQIERWYDVDVTFEAATNKQYYFTIPRKEPLTRLLRIMEKTGNVRFVIDGRNISVIP